MILESGTTDKWQDRCWPGTDSSYGYRGFLEQKVQTMSRWILVPLAFLSIGMSAGIAFSKNPVSVTACFTAPNCQQEAVLFVTARLSPGYWVYSITQPPGGPNRTVITLKPSSAFKVMGWFVTIQPPILEKTEFPDWPILEKHPGCVTWRASIQFAPGTNLSRLAIRGSIWGQVDTATFCIPPIDYCFTATLAQPEPAPGCCHPRHGFWRRVWPGKG